MTAPVVATAVRLVIGLRTAAPIVISSAGLLSVRSASYLLGYALGSISPLALPIVATLISLSAALFTNSCSAYQSTVSGIDAQNKSLMDAYSIVYNQYQI